MNDAEMVALTPSGGLLQGGFDQVDRLGAHGWVREHGVDAPVSLNVLVDDQIVQRVLANVYRADVQAAGFGDGRHGFAFELAGVSSLVTHILRVVREGDGMDIPGSPHTLPAATQVDDAMMAQLAVSMADTTDDAELTRRATFLAQQANRLLQLRADRRSRRPHPTAVHKYRVRWSGTGPAPDPEPKPRALVIDDHLPDTARDAGSQAMLSHARSLQRLGYDVSLAPANMEGGAMAESLEATELHCYCAPWAASVEEVLRRESRGFALIYLHRVGNACYLPLIRRYQPRAFVAYSVADLHFLRLLRQAEVEARPELVEASQRMRATELSAARFSDAVITHSSVEAALLKRDLPNARVHTVPWSVPPQLGQVPFDQRRGMAFIGSYNHAPNLDAAWYLIQEVMPLIYAQDPSIECQIVGSNMPDGLRAVVSPGIRIVGHVEALASVFDQVRLTIAPLTYGAGIKGKVLTSLAAGIPCVCTPVAAEGIELPPSLSELVAADPAGLAERVLRLHNDAGLNRTCADAGVSLIEAGFSETAVDAAMRQAVGLRTAT